MLVLAIKPGHDGAVVALQDSKLLFSLEGEGLFPTFLDCDAVEDLRDRRASPGQLDVVALGGWWKQGAGYRGVDAVMQRPGTWFGKATTMFTSSHERSHIMMAVGMAPKDSASVRAVLCYEGIVGSFYLLNHRWQVTSHISVLPHVGNRYNAVFALADPRIPGSAHMANIENAGKLMALAAYASRPMQTRESQKP